MCNYNKVIKEISDLNLNLKIWCNEPMSKHTSFKIGGNADIFIIINSINDLTTVIEILNNFNVPFFIIGNGSNLLVSDKGIRGAVIKLGGEFLNIKLIDENTIECGAGVLISKLCSFACQNSLSGLEFAYGIPGTAGGSVFMNAGAYGGEMKDVILSAKSLTFSGEIIDRSAEEMEFSYRRSIYRHVSEIILSAKFELKKDDKLHIKEKMNEYITRRKQKQPLEYPNAGSVFKRPVGNFAGTLIQTCGLKGKKIGGAMVSEKHSGFIINNGNATCEDVVNLIDHIKATVFEKSNIALECEVEIVGDFSS